MSEWRKVETGTDENGEPTHEYQFGGEIDGVFVPAVTKSAGYIEHIHSIAQAQADAEAKESPTTGSDAAIADEQYGQL